MLSQVHILTSMLKIVINPKFKVIDHMKKSKHKNIFAKCYKINWSDKAFITKKVKNTAPWTYVMEGCSSSNPKKIEKFNF